MNRCTHIAKVVLLGLVIAQVLATIQVYQSNAELSHTLATITEAGYLAVPNQSIMSRLQEFTPAVFGGLFFALSVGAGLSLLSFASAWVWDRLCLLNRFFLTLIIAAWVGVLVIVNLPRSDFMVTLYFLAIPPVLFVLTRRLMPPKDRERHWSHTVFPFVSFLLLALLWVPQMGSHLFLELRDNLLLSHPVGTKINDFYYRYTLYPAEVFKSLEQKMLKTCRIEHSGDESFVQTVERALINHDYLPLRAGLDVDMKVVRHGNTLLFENNGKPILKKGIGEFLAAPEALVKEFSLKTDSDAFFRAFTYYSILVAFPLTLYLFLYALFRFVLCLFIGLDTSSVISSVLCFLIGLVILVLFQQSGGGKIEVKDLAEALNSERWQRRVAALKIVQQNGIEVSDFPAYHTMPSSLHIPERYWLVRALGVSRDPGTFKDLCAFLDDPQPNVVCMAFYALGRRGNSQVANELIERIEASDHWYEQWYAYKALRTLGWKQTRFR